MSGPYCNDCIFYRAGILASGEGECKDPTKIIYYRYGEPMREAPLSNPYGYCSNHTSRELTTKEQTTKGE